MEQKTQQDIVLEKLIREGEVSNFWAIQNYILRLGAIACQLKKQGWNITGDFETVNGKKTKNYVYKYIKA